MNIKLFNKKYWARRFSEQIVIRGYLSSTYKDFVVSLNVHPMGADQLQALPEGERKVKRLEAHGTDVLISADQDNGIKGDLLFYQGNWYECISAQKWDHTPLSHINYQFVMVPSDASHSTDIENKPTQDPRNYQKGGEVS